MPIPGAQEAMEVVPEVTEGVPEVTEVVPVVTEGALEAMEVL